MAVAVVECDQDDAGLTRGPARRMTTPGRLMLLAAALSLVVACAAACGGGGSPSRAATRLPTPTAHHTSGTTTQGQAPFSQCHLVSAKVLAGRAVDHSRPVSCSSPHNLETVGFQPVYTKLKLPSGMSFYLGQCAVDELNFLHLEIHAVTRLEAYPIAAPKAGGHAMVRCDLGVQAGIGGGLWAPTVVRTSIAAQASARLNAAWDRCTNDSPFKTPVRFSSCGRPHRVETYGLFVQLPLRHGYPSTAAITVRGTTRCRQAIAQRPNAAALGVHGVFDTEQQWIHRGRLTALRGVCWVFRRDHKNLPAQY